MTSSYGWAVAETMLALLGVCLLAVVSLKWLAKRGFGVGPRAGGDMSVLERLPLDARRSLVVVRVRGRTLLLGLGESGAPVMLTELGDGEPARSFRDLLVQTSGINQESADRRQADDPSDADRRIIDG